MLANIESELKPQLKEILTRVINILRTYSASRGYYKAKLPSNLINSTEFAHDHEKFLGNTEGHCYTANNINRWGSHSGERLFIINMFRNVMDDSIEITDEILLDFVSRFIFVVNEARLFSMFIGEDGFKSNTLQQIFKVLSETDIHQCDSREKRRNEKVEKIMALKNISLLFCSLDFEVVIDYLIKNPQSIKPFLEMYLDYLNPNHIRHIIYNLSEFIDSIELFNKIINRVIAFYDEMIFLNTASKKSLPDKPVVLAFVYGLQQTLLNPVTWKWKRHNGLINQYDNYGLYFIALFQNSKANEILFNCAPIKHCNEFDTYKIWPNSNPVSFRLIHESKNRYFEFLKLVFNAVKKIDQSDLKEIAETEMKGMIVSLINHADFRLKAPMGTQALYKIQIRSELMQDILHYSFQQLNPNQDRIDSFNNKYGNTHYVFLFLLFKEIARRQSHSCLLYLPSNLTFKQLSYLVLSLIKSDLFLQQHFNPVELLQQSAKASPVELCLESLNKMLLKQPYIFHMNIGKYYAMLWISFMLNNDVTCEYVFNLEYKDILFFCIVCLQPLAQYGNTEGVSLNKKFITAVCQKRNRIPLLLEALNYTVLIESQLNQLKPIRDFILLAFLEHPKFALHYLQSRDTILAEQFYRIYDPLFGNKIVELINCYPNSKTMFNQSIDKLRSEYSIFSSSDRTINVDSVKTTNVNKDTDVEIELTQFGIN